MDWACGHASPTDMPIRDDDHGEAASEQVNRNAGGSLPYGYLQRYVHESPVLCRKERSPTSELKKNTGPVVFGHRQVRDPISDLSGQFPIPSRCGKGWHRQ